METSPVHARRRRFWSKIRGRRPAIHLKNTIERTEYIHISIKDIPNEIINEYQPRKIVEGKGSIHIQANRGMYGLPQAGLLANEILEKRLKKRGY